MHKEVNYHFQQIEKNELGHWDFRHLNVSKKYCKVILLFLEPEVHQFIEKVIWKMRTFKYFSWTKTNMKVILEYSTRSPPMLLSLSMKKQTIFYIFKIFFSSKCHRPLPNVQLNEL